MTAKSFVDTNVVLYTIGKDARKADIARKLVGAQPAIMRSAVHHDSERRTSNSGVTAQHVNGVAAALESFVRIPADAHLRQNEYTTRFRNSGTDHPE